MECAHMTQSRNCFSHISYSGIPFIVQNHYSKFEVIVDIYFILNVLVQNQWTCSLVFFFPALTCAVAISLIWVVGIPMVKIGGIFTIACSHQYRVRYHLQVKWTTISCRNYTSILELLSIWALIIVFLKCGPIASSPHYNSVFDLHLYWYFV